MPDPTDFPDPMKYIKPPKQPLDRLTGFAQERGLTVTSTKGGRHNPGSQHYQGNAVDVRTKDQPDDYISDVMKQAAALGYRVRDERTRPAGQKEWGGPHLHLEGTPEAAQFDGMPDPMKYVKKPSAPVTEEQRVKEQNALLQSKRPPVAPEGSGAVNREFDKLRRPAFQSIVADVLANQEAEKTRGQIATEQAVQRNRGTVDITKPQRSAVVDRRLQENKPIVPRLATQAIENNVRKPDLFAMEGRAEGPATIPPAPPVDRMERQRQQILARQKQEDQGAAQNLLTALSPATLVLPTENRAQLAEPLTGVAQDAKRILSSPIDIQESGRRAGALLQKLPGDFIQGGANLVDSLMQVATPGAPATASEFVRPRIERANREIEAEMGINPMAPTSVLDVGAQGAISSLPYLVTGGVGAGAKGVMAMGALQKAGQTYQEAVAKGADPNTALRASQIDAPIGALEGAFGVEAQLAKAGVSQTLARSFAHALQDIPSEMAQEVLSQVVNNLNAVYASGYDKDRRVLDGVVESAIGALATGGAMAGASAVSRGGQAIRQQNNMRQANAQEAALLQEAEQYRNPAQPGAHQYQTQVVPIAGLKAAQAQEAAQLAELEALQQAQTPPSATPPVIPPTTPQSGAADTTAPSSMPGEFVPRVTDTTGMTKTEAMFARADDLQYNQKAKDKFEKQQAKATPKATPAEQSAAQSAKTEQDLTEAMQLGDARVIAHAREQHLNALKRQAVNTPVAERGAILAQIDALTPPKGKANAAPSPVAPVTPAAQPAHSVRPAEPVAQPAGGVQTAPQDETVAPAVVASSNAKTQEAHAQEVVQGNPAVQRSAATAGEVGSTITVKTPRGNMQGEVVSVDENGTMRVKLPNGVIVPIKSPKPTGKIVNERTAEQSETGTVAGTTVSTPAQATPPAGDGAAATTEVPASTVDEGDAQPTARESDIYRTKEGRVNESQLAAIDARAEKRDSTATGEHGKISAWARKSFETPQGRTTALALQPELRRYLGLPAIPANADSSTLNKAAHHTMDALAERMGKSRSSEIDHDAHVDFLAQNGPRLSPAVVESYAKTLAAQQAQQAFENGTAELPEVQAALKEIEDAQTQGTRQSAKTIREKFATIAQTYGLPKAAGERFANHYFKLGKTKPGVSTDVGRDVQGRSEPADARVSGEITPQPATDTASAANRASDAQQPAAQPEPQSAEQAGEQVAKPDFLTQETPAKQESVTPDPAPPDPAKVEVLVNRATSPSAGNPSNFLNAYQAKGATDPVYAEAARQVEAILAERKGKTNAPTTHPDSPMPKKEVETVTTRATKSSKTTQLPVSEKPQAQVESKPPPAPPAAPDTTPAKGISENAKQGKLPTKFAAGVNPKQVAQEHGLPADFYVDGRYVGKNGEGVMSGDVVVNDKYDPTGAVEKAVTKAQEAQRGGYYESRIHQVAVEKAMAAAVARVSQDAMPTTTVESDFTTATQRTPLLDQQAQKAFTKANKEIESAKAAQAKLKPSASGFTAQQHAEYTKQQSRIDAAEKTKRDAQQYARLPINEEASLKILQEQYDDLQAKIEALGKEPPKPNSESRYFGTKGRAGANPEVVARYDAAVKAHQAWQRKHSQLRKEQSSVSQSLYSLRLAKKLAPTENTATGKDSSFTTSALGVGAFSKFNDADLSTIVKHALTHAKDFVAFGRAMLKDFGASIRPQLRALWDGVKEFAQDEKGQLNEGVIVEKVKQAIRDLSEKSSSTTQIATTTGSYRKLLQKGLSITARAKDVLDYGAGLGLGTDAMRADAPGVQVDSYEPFPQRWKGEKPPTYTDAEKIDKQYNVVINPNVLNVLRKPLRDMVVKDIYAKVKPGGVALITVRRFKGDVNQAKNFTPTEETGAIIIHRGSEDVFQKGFDGQELVNYLREMLPDAQIERYTEAGEGAIVRKPVRESSALRAQRGEQGMIDFGALFGKNGKPTPAADAAFREKVPVPKDFQLDGFIKEAKELFKGANLGKRAEAKAITAFEGVMESFVNGDGAKLMEHQNDLRHIFGSKWLVVADFLRPLNATGEISYVGRQGMIGWQTHPILSMKAFQEAVGSKGGVLGTLKATGKHLLTNASDAHYWDFVAKFANSESRKFAEKAGLGFAHTEEIKLSGKHFFGAEENAMVSKAQRLPLLKQMERLNKAFIDGQRLRIFDWWLGRLEKKGVPIMDADGKPTIHAIEVAKEINRMTGRGNVHEKVQPLVDAAGVAAFSPRFAISTMQFLNPARIAVTAKRSPQVAKQQALQYAEVAALSTAFALTLKSLGFALNMSDPDKDDFLVAKLGNWRIPILQGGLHSQAKLAVRMMLRLQEMGAGDMDTKGKGLDKGKQQLGTYLRYKEAPLAGLVHNQLFDRREAEDYKTGEKRTFGHNALGQPVPFLADLGSRAVPMTWQQVAEAYQQEGLLGVAKTAPEFGGLTSNLYESRREPLSENDEKVTGKELVKRRWSFSEGNAVTDKLPFGRDTFTRLGMRAGYEPHTQFAARTQQGKALYSEASAPILGSDWYKQATPEKQEWVEQRLQERVATQVNNGKQEPQKLTVRALEAAWRAHEGDKKRTEKEAARKRQQATQQAQGR